MKVMTVGELKTQLNVVPDNIPVFLYNGLDEGDCELAKVELVTRGRYCKGDSYVDEYLAQTGAASVLLLHDDY